MNTKLTLRLDDTAIEKGKLFAAKNNTSLSQMVENYFLLLGTNDELIDTLPVSKKLHSLLGIGSGEYSEKEYLEHIERKHS